MSEETLEDAMSWHRMDSAPRDGTPITYPWQPQVVSTCIWLDGCWWDTRVEEPVTPQKWAPIDDKDDQDLASLPEPNH